MEEAAILLRGKRFAVATGAGISTASGIPDYRGQNSPERSPMTYQQFREDPDFRQSYWARNHIGWRHVDVTQPNSGHQALAALEGDGLVTGIITQNVDRLHQRAGSQNVVDLHGNYQEVVCLDCGRTETRAHLAKRLEALNPGFRDRLPADLVDIAPDADADIPLEVARTFTVATCQYCGGVLKPQIVYFGETVPPETIGRAFSIIDEADALLVVGSSLVVQSGMRLVRRALADGIPLVIINHGATKADEYATVRIDADAPQTLVSLAKLLRVRAS